MTPALGWALIALTAGRTCPYEPNCQEQAGPERAGLRELDGGSRRGGYGQGHPCCDETMWRGLWDLWVLPGQVLLLPSHKSCPIPTSRLCCCLGVRSLTSQQPFACENEIRKVFQVFVSVQRQTSPEPALFVPSAGPQLGKTAGKAVGDVFGTSGDNAEYGEVNLHVLWGTVSVQRGAGRATR